MTIELSRRTAWAVASILAMIGIGVLSFVIGKRIAPKGTGQAGQATAVAATGPASTVAPVATDSSPRIQLADFKSEYDAKQDIMLIDVRTASSYDAGHIPGAINIPEASVSARQNEIPRDKQVVLYCA